MKCTNCLCSSNLRGIARCGRQSGRRSHSASQKGGWEYLWRNHSARLGRGCWGPSLDLAILLLLQSGTTGSFSREPVLRALWGPVCLCVCICVLVNVNTGKQWPPFQGGCGRCRRLGSWAAEAAVLHSRAGFSNPIVSFRFARAYPPLEPEIRAGRYRGPGLEA